MNRKEGWELPTRRIFELIVVTGILIRPAFGLVHLWSLKALNVYPEGSVRHNIAQVGAILS